MAVKRVLVVGLGNMGMSHALAYQRIQGFEVAGVCERRIDRRELPAALASAARFSSVDEALCEREQRYLLKAIDEDIDLTEHMNDAVKSLKIVLAAEQSIALGRW